MLDRLGFASTDELIDAVIPGEIRCSRPMDIPAARTEGEVVAGLRQLSETNQVFRSCIGMGYHDTITPPVIGRNVLENPGWYTQYTPYQAEIAQGRLEALLNFQTMIVDLTGLPLAGASLLDEATAAAEAMTMAQSIAGGKRSTIFVADDCHPQTIALVQTRAQFAGLNVVVGSAAGNVWEAETDDWFAVLLQVPATTGQIRDYTELAAEAKRRNILTIAAADLFSLAMIRPPGEWGADICIGSAQRFGVPMGLGGPHAAFLSTHDKYAKDARQDHRCGKGRGRTPSAEDGHADSRAAHPTRQSDVKYLHRPSFAGDHQFVLRHLSWSRGHSPDRRSNSINDPGIGRGTGPTGAQRCL